MYDPDGSLSHLRGAKSEMERRKYFRWTGENLY